RYGSVPEFVVERLGLGLGAQYESAEAHASADLLQRLDHGTAVASASGLPQNGDALQFARPLTVGDDASRGHGAASRVQGEHVNSGLIEGVQFLLGRDVLLLDEDLAPDVEGGFELCGRGDR